MEAAPENPAATSALAAPDVHRLQCGGREIVLIGTAHISHKSARLVRAAVAEYSPDGLCVELDARRFEALANPERFAALDLRAVIRQRQLATLGLTLALSAYQRALGRKLGVQPGAEFLAAAQAAKAQNIPLHLCDREIGCTMRRALRALSFWKRMMFASAMLAGFFEKQTLDENKLEELRSADLLSHWLQELGESFPGLKRALVDERDEYLAERIRQCPGRKLMAVVGAGHVPGLKKRLAQNTDSRNPEESAARLAALEEIPPVRKGGRTLVWGIPALIIGALLWIGFTQGAQRAGENAAFWVLANGIPSAVGAALALSHPLVVVAAFCAAPITSLIPVIGAGYVTGALQAWLRPPRVHEFAEAPDAFSGWRRFRKNRLLRIVCVFVLTTLGSMAGTCIGGSEILHTAAAG